MCSTQIQFKITPYPPLHRHPSARSKKPSLRNAAFHQPKHGLLRPERQPFARSKASFCTPSGNTLITNRLQCCQKSKPFQPMSGLSLPLKTHSCAIKQAWERWCAAYLLAKIRYFSDTPYKKEQNLIFNREKYKNLWRRNKIVAQKLLNE